MNLRGCKAKLTQQEMEAIDALVQKHPDFTIRETKETLQLNISEGTIRQAASKHWIMSEKEELHTSERERPRCEGKTYTEGRIRKETTG